MGGTPALRAPRYGRLGYGPQGRPRRPQGQEQGQGHPGRRPGRAPLPIRTLRYHFYSVLTVASVTFCYLFAICIACKSTVKDSVWSGISLKSLSFSH